MLIQFSLLPRLVLVERAAGTAVERARESLLALTDSPPRCADGRMMGAKDFPC